MLGVLPFRRLRGEGEGEEGAKRVAASCEMIRLCQDGVITLPVKLVKRVTLSHPLSKYYYKSNRIIMLPIAVG